MKKRIVKYTLVLVLAAVALTGAILGHEYLQLERVRAAHYQLLQLYKAYPALFIGVYSVAYILITLAAIPGGAVLTVLAGAVFGIWIGVPLMSLTGLVGASCAFLVSRFVLRNWVERHFGDRLETINRGLDEEGAFYLFTLRLIHILPFFIVNYAMGVTRIRLRTFAWVTWAAMLPGTFVFVNAGAQFSQVESIRDILSWQVLGSLALLGLFPLAAKKSVDYLNRLAARRKSHPSSRTTGK